ncbi:hypothetical protein NE237_002757 [Protea cynaroides]|uniref:Uncharacterized protein n=1 Tax=Protea cynaroides TaxID=273540 RepID=A0A9Q0QRY5_9MAGN|nr:hypothetical protein NE237_002757 [Protea cynaroides]
MEPKSSVDATPMSIPGSHKPDASASFHSSLERLLHHHRPHSSTFPTHPITLTSSSSPYPTASRTPQPRFQQMCAEAEAEVICCLISDSLMHFTEGVADSLKLRRFGSLANIDEAEFVEMAWGLANYNSPFLWVVRSDLVHGSERVETLWPDGFLEMKSGKGCSLKWAPQQEVLAPPAVGGFWTHNGWNSTLESISKGVPMLCWPSFGDQMVNVW